VKTGIMPKTHLGKWSVGLILAFFLLFMVLQILVAAGQQGGATFFDNLLLSIPAFLGVIAGIASFASGIISILKNKERSVFVFLATAAGLLILIFVLGEIVFPH